MSPKITTINQGGLTATGITHNRRVGTSVFSVVSLNSDGGKAAILVQQIIDRPTTKTVENIRNTECKTKTLGPRMFARLTTLREKNTKNWK